ncbi:formate dehydrogenase accessory sulfurtransferase FdhD [Psychrosphaera sp. 1_MG-2023]|uniref:formate dehydrogenase accessory sulfurtransferase FdhD n=1 Tax=Psychrosphaera sp. 1_MG-2023 TaxID=3062643 RepID=UPI0026E3399B|nr:formate dehydrogenase accessory sulfurtransferase FdhD [Psychrosphaera sp. 1_MG-2023]MDO6719385.1 formate dehydrogenase accessory sulfurtransferase FdhD [Psychrosphaera sp. 1_MG-2023]
MPTSATPLKALSTHLVEEHPVAIEINQVSYAVMLASPHDLEEFVIGFLLSNLVISHNRDIHDINISQQDNAYIVNVIIANRCLVNLQQRQRQLKGTTGCGLCGTETLTQAFPTLPTLPAMSAISPNLKTTLSVIRRKLSTWQTLAKNSGALHAAFWLNTDGQIVACREDIGRHNALDKLIGYLLKNGIDRRQGAILMTSRCSVELVQKSILAGVPTLISLASPSQFAVNLAAEHNLLLVQIPKKDQPIYYGIE